MNLKIGDPWPFQSRRGLVGAKCEPVWHALICAPQREAKTQALLNGSGIEVSYPTVERVRHVQGKKRVYVSPMISQIVYARFTYEPQWDVLKERRVITGVFARDGVPIALSADDVARVMGLPTEAERMEQERIEALRPRVGEKAAIRMPGIGGDFMVDVVRVEFGRVWWEHFSGLKGDAAEAMVRRVAG